MMLLTKAIIKRTPDLRATDGQGDDAIVQAKFFHPMSNWTWFLLELEKDDTDPRGITGVAFGLVSGHEIELGAFDMHELETVRVHGLGIERDMYWDPRPLSEVRKSLEERRWA